MFTDAKGDPLHPDKVTARFAVLQEKLRAQIVQRHEESGAKGDPPVLSRIRLHDLRHTWPTLALVAGERPKVRAGAARPRDDLYHHGHLLPRDAGHARGGGRAGRGAVLRVGAESKDLRRILAVLPQGRGHFPAKESGLFQVRRW